MAVLDPVAVSARAARLQGPNFDDSSLETRSNAVGYAMPQDGIRFFWAGTPMSAGR
jgi:hypothetical protein